VAQGTKSLLVGELERLLPRARRCRWAVLDGKRPRPVDATAQDEFFALLRKVMTGYAQRNLAQFDATTRDEFVEDVCSTALQALPKLKIGPGKPPLGVWLVAVAKKLTARLRRARRRSRARPLQNDLASSRDDPEQLLLRQETIDHVHHALQQLHEQVSQRDYEVLVLLDMEGWTVKEVCKRLKLTPRQVWDHHYRAKRVLRQILERQRDP